MRKGRKPRARTHAPVHRHPSTGSPTSRTHLLLIGSGAALAASVAVPAAASAAPSFCDEPFDVYKAPAAKLAACGVKTFPLKDRRPTPDGGTAFEYDVHGKPVSFMVPPAGFDARRASPDDLARYGIPRRPSDAPGQARWDKAVGKQSFVKPPSFLAEIPVKAGNIRGRSGDGVKANVFSYNWSGYLDYNSGGGYTQSTGVYTEPVDHGTTCSNNAAVFWVGIGGYITQNLAQDGTAINTPTLGQHQAWKEILPASISPVNLYATPGQSFKATTHWLGNKWQFVLYNEYTGQQQTINVNNTSYDGTSSEFIGERPEYNGSLMNLTNFGNLNWGSAQTNGAPVQNFANHPGVNMYDYPGGTRLLAAPSTNPGTNGGFTDTWKRCS